MPRTRKPIDHGWRLHGGRLAPDAPVTEVDVAAEVPGVVHLDLLRTGLIADPYLDRNEEDQHWIGRSEWSYRCSIPLPTEATTAERIELVADGLDTVAEIRVGGDSVARTANQHRRYRFDVTAAAAEAVSAGRPILDVAIDFAAPTVEAEALARRGGHLPNPYDRPYNYLRKSACNFGWDWGPRLTTSGIWRPLAIETWSVARLAAVRPTATVDDDGTGRLSIVVEIERTDGAAGGTTEPIGLSVEARVRTPDGSELATVASIAPTTSTMVTAELVVEVPSVERWWPVGHGQPTLHELDVELWADGQAAALDRNRSRIGFRNVAIDTTAVDDGTRWAITVNGQRIWVRGVNWIPDDCFPSRVDRGRYADRLDQALAANVNLIRVWGGGVYESDDFYELCDERGLLVWQDFLFACAAYDEGLLGDEVRAEASDNVDRLMGHPSLALWCGNNENLWGWWSWGWPEQVGDRSWGEGFYREVLPTVVAERDPARPYIEGSPSSGHPDRHPNDQDHGPMHIWTVWNELDYRRYRDVTPRFVAEFGYQAPPASATLQHSISSRPLAAGQPDLANHQKADDGQAKLNRGLVTHFVDPEDLPGLLEPERFDHWLYLTQLNQARAVTVGVGHLRRLHQRCSGAIWWQLNDCWPAVSWSVVDGAGRRKLAWYALRRAFADRVLVVEPDGDGLAVIAVNDGGEPWTDPLSVRRVGVRGEVRAERSFALDVAPRSSAKLLLPAEVGDVRSDELVVADQGSCRSVHSVAVDRELGLAPGRHRARVEQAGDTVMVEVVADGPVRDLCLLADRFDPDAEVDSQLVTLLPGEVHRFVVDGLSTHDDLAALTEPPVLLSVADALIGR